MSAKDIITEILFFSIYCLYNKNIELNRFFVKTIQILTKKHTFVKIRSIILKISQIIRNYYRHSTKNTI